MRVVNWTTRERSAWRPGERLTPAHWAERFRVLTPDQTSQPGPVRLSRMPHTRGFLTLLAMPGILEIWVQKCAQSGFSETVRHYVGWLADQSPCPVMLVLPDEKKGRQIVSERIIPLFMQPEPLRRLATESKRDRQLSSIHLINGFVLFLAWAGSPSSLAAHPIRVGIADEVDKFPTFSGKEANPIALLSERLKTFRGQRLLVATSTPTIADGPIATGREACPIQLRYLVGCPACSHWQPIVFPRLRYPQPVDRESTHRHADRVEAGGACVYPCARCATEIPESMQRTILSRGVWGSVSAADESWFDGAARLGAGMPGGLDAPPSAYGTLQRTQAGGGIVTAGWPAGRRVGLCVSDLDIANVPWSETASKWIRSHGEIDARMAFINNNLGEPFAQQIARPTVTAFAEKAAASTSEPDTAPEWALVCLAAADVQKDAIYYVIRAWGPGYRSVRVRHGVVANFDELRRLSLDTAFPVGKTGRSIRCAALGIDSGYRTQEVYAVALKDAARIKVLRGESDPAANPIRLSRGTYRPPPGVPDPRGQVWVHRLDTGHFKDRLTAYIAGDLEEIDDKGEVIGRVEQWGLSAAIDDDYARQMSSEHKVLIRKGRTHVPTWKLISEHSPNHYWDCEVYQIALADIVRVESFAPRRPKAPPPRELPPNPIINRRPLAVGRGPIRTRY